MAGQRPGEAPGERAEEAACRDQEPSPIDAPDKTDPLVEAEVVAGHGANSTLEFQPRRVGLARSVAALRHPDFRLYWGGQVVSLVGTWMQIVAQSWLVLQLSDSALILGIVSALQFLPILTLSVLGGVAADRLPRRQLLLVTQFVALLLAFALGALIETGLVRIPYIMLLAVLLGLVNAVDMPTRQAFVVDLVGGDDLPNAIALNSVAFNSARLIGPAVAGLAIGLVGIAGGFFLNGLSYLAAIGTLLAVRAGREPPRCRAQGTRVRDDLREGFAYVVNTPLIWLVVLLVALVGTFGMNLNVLIPVFARDTLRVGATGFGFLASAAGVGSLAAAVLLASLGRTPRPELLLGAAAALGLMEMALAAVRQFALAIVVLAGIGFSLTFFTTLANTILQETTPDALRGRVMSVFATVFAGTTPIGNLLVGGLAEVRGVGVAFFATGLVSVGSAVAVHLVGRGPQR